MIIFMKYNARGDPAECLYIGNKVFIHKLKRYLFMPVNIFPDFRDAQAAFVIDPLLTIYTFHMSIYKYLFDSRRIRIIYFFIFLIHIAENLFAIYYKKSYILIHLRGSQTHPAAGIHGFPHINNKLLKTRIIRVNVLANFS